LVGVGLPLELPLDPSDESEGLDTKKQDNIVEVMKVEIPA